jgi:hypothetical protein
VIGADLGPPLESGAVAAQRWPTQQQLPSALVSGYNACTLLGYVARSLRSDSSLLQRH